MTPAVARPRFRTDLVAEPIQEDGKRFIDVFDPDSGVGFRFYEVEYSLACAMDGERDVAGLVRWAKEELGVEPSAKELTTVISTLGGLGYLSEERGDGVGLVEGVVSAPPQAAPRVEDVELGTAGANVPAVTADLPPIDMELGEAGGVAPERVVVDDFGAGPDLAAPARDDFPQPPSAAVPVAQLQPRTIPDSDLDGPTDLPRPVPLAAGDEDVSTDLSDHLAISASDVKEAVRASRVMQAVTVPADIAATLAAAEAEEEAARAAAAKIAAEKAAAEAAAAADRAAADKAAADKAAADKAAAEAAAAADKAAADKAAADKVAADKAAADRAAADKAAADKAAADKAADKAAAEKAAAEKAAADKAAADKAAAAKTAAEKAALDKPTTPAAEPRTSRFLIFLLVVVIVLAGFYLVWTQLLKKPLPWEKAEPTAAAKAPTPPPAPPPPPTPPPPAPTPPAVLTAVKGTTSDVAASRKGTVATVVADGSTVAVGDVLVQFVAQPALTKQLAASKKRLDIELPKLITELTNKRDAAQAAGKVELAKTHQERLDKQLVVKSSLEAEVASLTTQLEAYAVRAQLAGTVKTVVAKGDRIENPEQVIVAITGPDTSTATFTLSPDNKKVYSAGGSVLLTVKTDPGQKANCTVAAVQGPSVTVACPPDVTIAPGTEVLLD